MIGNDDGGDAVSNSLVRVVRVDDICLWVAQ
jgi:hypothetical protein